MTTRDQGFDSTLPMAAITSLPSSPLQQGLGLLNADTPEHARAAGCFRAAAERGDRDGIAYFGLCLLEGLGLPADPVRARAELERAAAKGSAMGRFQFGRMLMTGRGGPVDESRGLAAYLSAASLGHAEATFNLANCLTVGVGCLPDRLAGKALYLRARKLGCTLRPQGVRVKQRELKAVRALAQRFTDPNRLVLLIQERQEELRLLHALAQARPKARQTAGKPQAWHLATGVMAAMAGTLGQYLRPPSRDAGPTTLSF